MDIKNFHPMLTSSANWRTRINQADLETLLAVKAEYSAKLSNAQKSILNARIAELTPKESAQDHHTDAEY